MSDSPARPSALVHVAIIWTRIGRASRRRGEEIAVRGRQVVHGSATRTVSVNKADRVRVGGRRTGSDRLTRTRRAGATSEDARVERLGHAVALVRRGRKALRVVGVFALADTRAALAIALAELQELLLDGRAIGQVAVVVFVNVPALLREVGSGVGGCFDVLPVLIIARTDEAVVGAGEADEGQVLDDRRHSGEEI